VAYPLWSMTWPVFMASKHGGNTHFLISWNLGILIPTNLLFLHVSCIFGLFLLEIWQFWGKDIPQTPLTKLAHDFFLRRWFKKIAKTKNKIPPDWRCCIIL
jgi:hypothetical protein